MRAKLLLVLATVTVLAHGDDAATVAKRALAHDLRILPRGETFLVRGQQTSAHEVLRIVNTREMAAEEIEALQMAVSGRLVEKRGLNDNAVAEIEFLGREIPRLSASFGQLEAHPRGKPGERAALGRLKLHYGVLGQQVPGFTSLEQVSQARRGLTKGREILEKYLKDFVNRAYGAVPPARERRPASVPRPPTH